MPESNRRFSAPPAKVSGVLRAMRMMHFLSWCAIQSGDLNFHATFPDWGSESFWRRELCDLKRQLELIRYERRNFRL